MKVIVIDRDSLYELCTTSIDILPDVGDTLNIGELRGNITLAQVIKKRMGSCKWKRILCSNNSKNKKVMTTFEIILLSVLIYFSGVILAAVFGAIVDAQDGNAAKDEAIYICYASYFVAVILLVVLIARLLKFIPLKVYRYINNKFLCSH